MKEKSNKYLITAILMGLVFHSSAIFFTLENTYDAFNSFVFLLIIMQIAGLNRGTIAGTPALQ
jgi:hypothetical protein